MASKAVLGFVWFFVNYFIRFCVNLLIEPQINPIKHFPVVTVSHKILLPLTVPFDSRAARAAGERVGRYDRADGGATAAGRVRFLGLGAEGKLASLRRQQAARTWARSRSAITARAMLQFIKPGFRSGTLPKLFAKLRRANRKAYWTGKWKTADKQLAGLRRSAEDLRRFFDRDLLLLLHHCRGWQGWPIKTGQLALGTNRILLELQCHELSADSLWLSFSEQSGWLVAGTHRRGWLDVLREPQRTALDNALAGVYKMAGVDVVQDQLDARLGPHQIAYELDDQGLKVWPLRSPQDTVRFALSDWPPTGQHRDLPGMLSTLDSDSVRGSNFRPGPHYLGSLGGGLEPGPGPWRHDATRAGRRIAYSRAIARDVGPIQGLADRCNRAYPGLRQSTINYATVSPRIPTIVAHHGCHNVTRHYQCLYCSSAAIEPLTSPL